MPAGATWRARCMPPTARRRPRSQTAASMCATWARPTSAASTSPCRRRRGGLRSAPLGRCREQTPCSDGGPPPGVPRSSESQMAGGQLLPASRSAQNIVERERIRRLQLGEIAILGVLVGAPAQEPGGVPEAAVLELLEADLADQLGPDLGPVEVLGPGPPAGRAGGAALAEAVASNQWLELFQDLHALLRRERRGVAGMGKDTLVVVQAEQQRAHPASGGVGAVAPDDPVGRPGLLDLDHGPLPGGVDLAPPPAPPTVSPPPPPFT